MVQKNKLRVLLVTGLFLVSLGGWLLHVRIHSPSKLDANYIPFIIGLLSWTIIPAMFLFRKTTAYAYVINGMMVIIGTITMTHFSLVHLPAHITYRTPFTGTLLADIAILMTNFVLGKSLFELEMLKTEETPGRQGRFFRYPNMGWWLVHLFALSTAYVLGHFLWD
jgi:hypothetical protein